MTGPEIKVGDLVRYEEHRVSKIDKSFAPKFRNTLYRVVEKLSNANWRIEEVGPGDKKDLRVAHYNQIKLVEEPRAVERPQRTVRKPARLDDFDLDDGAPKIS